MQQLQTVVTAISTGAYTVNGYATSMDGGSSCVGMASIDVLVKSTTAIVTEKEGNPVGEGIQQQTPQLIPGGGNSITVRGQFFFCMSRSPDWVPMPIKGAEIEVFDDDGILGAQSMGKGHTRDDGSFEITGLEPPLDVTELFDGPDVYVRVYARNWVVDIRNNPVWLLGGTFSFRTAIHGNVGEHDAVEFGAVTCPADQDVVFETYNMLQVSYWFFRDQTGTAPPQVKAFIRDVFTPASSYYFPKSMPHIVSLIAIIPTHLITAIGLDILLQDVVGLHYQENNLIPNPTYVDYTHHVMTHEYGHFLMDQYADFYPPWSVLSHEYDLPYDKEHAFVEGWAHFFSAAARKSWGMPESEYRDAPKIEDNVYQGDNVEASIAGVLWDIFDDEADSGDTLHMSFGTIWNVLTDYDPEMLLGWPIGRDHPWDIYDFWDGFRFSNSGEPVSGLYNILDAHGITIADGQPPSNPTALSVLSSHVKGEVNSDDNVVIEWSDAWDNIGIQDYLVYWTDSEPQSYIPSFGSYNSMKYLVDDVDGVGSTSKTLSDGEWWVVIRSRDLGGNQAGGAFYDGPFLIGDPAKPFTTLSMQLAQSSVLGTFVTSASSFTLLTTPSKEGSEETQTFYRFKGYDSEFRAYSEAVNFDGLTSGEYTIEFYAEDALGNRGDTANAVVILDVIPPTTNLDFGDPQYTSTRRFFITGHTSITLNAHDYAKGIGVAWTKYRISSFTYDSGWQIYSGPFTLPTLPDGYYVMEYYSQDKAGNVEETKRANFNIDDTAPSLRINPVPGIALAGEVSLVISAFDYGSNADRDSMELSILRVGEDGLEATDFMDIPLLFDPASLTWGMQLDTTQLPDNYYAIRLRTQDHIRNVAEEVFSYSVSNSQAQQMFPATQNSKAGRTMPIRFSLKVSPFIDPAQPFVHDEDLTVRISLKSSGLLLQKSTFGASSNNYRIDDLGQKYIVNFPTLKNPTTYQVEVLRGQYLLAVFQFTTSK